MVGRLDSETALISLSSQRVLRLAATVTLSSGKKHMLSRRMSVGAALGLLICSLPCGTARAQFFGSSCGCGPVSGASVAAWTPMQPAYSACYQTVPVTSYVQEKQTVEVPTYETDWETRKVTVYRPVTQTKEIEVPTVSYQNVTEYQTVNRDMGRWITRYHPVTKYAPCQVDPRPGVVGWFNRTGYSMRTAFMPNYTTSREYVPNLVTCNVPVTRQVAVRGTQRVSVQETRMVAEAREEKVQVQRLVMKKEQRVVMRPETSWRTVPIGTATAFGPWIGGTQTVYGAPSSRTAAAPAPDPIGGGSAERSAEGSDGERRFERSANDGENVRGSGYEREIREPNDSDPDFPLPQTKRTTEPSGNRSARSRVVVETASVRTSDDSGWHASRRPRSSEVAGVSSASPALSAADTVGDN
jgi:hypothetical protein